MLRRPMMYITSVFCAAIIGSYYLGAEKALILMGVTALFLLHDQEESQFKITVLIMIISFSAGTLCYIWHDGQEKVISEYTGEDVNVVCRVLTITPKETVEFDGSKSQHLQLKASVGFVDEKPVEYKEKVLINCYSCFDGAIPGEEIEVYGRVETPEGRKNPGCFDYALYLRSIGVDHIINAESIKICTTSENKNIMSRISGLLMGKIYETKEMFMHDVEKSAGKKIAGIVRAVMFGEKTYLDEEMLEEFRKNGTAHILAVSGLHIGMIYGCIFAVWRWKKGKMYFSLVTVFFLVYMVMASFAPSVVRAVIMVMLHIYAKINDKRYDIASAAFFTALIMLVKEPMQIFNMGFQMSFLAVLTLSLFLPIIKHFYSGVFMASFAIQAGLAPYTIFVFNYFSLAAVFINVPVIFLAGIIVPSGLCCMFAMAVFQPLGAFIAKGIGSICMIMESLNSFTCIEGITVFDVRSPHIWFVVVYYLILLVFVSEDGRLMIMRKRQLQIKRMMCIVIFVSILFSFAAGNRFKNSDIVFVDVGQGDCIHIRADNGVLNSGKDYLIDGGGSISYEIGKNTLKPYLLKNGTKKIEAAFVTHMHTDHYKGIAELCREDMVKRLYVYEGYKIREAEIIEDTGLEKDQIMYLHAGQKIIMGEDAFVEILWPDAGNSKEYERMMADETDENSLCLIMKITVGNKSLLVTGDVDSSCLDHLAKKYGGALNADILKAAHHGSRYSDSVSFVAAAKPEYAVFQVGKNNFGHPDEGVVENFRQKGIMIYRNDLDGAVAFDIRRNGLIKVRTVKGE